MGPNGVWVTDVEFVATATLLQTDVFVYTPYANNLRCLKYGKLFTLPDERIFAGNIYLTNIIEHLN